MVFEKRKLNSERLRLPQASDLALLNFMNLSVRKKTHFRFWKIFPRTMDYDGEAVRIEIPSLPELHSCAGSYR
ncbi:hypothetical protein MCW_00172 [Cardidatus Bartonella washoeensis 085-0475]|uniref:Uncharacterized protein n=1 Tax=Cardidatus Bartonella washoeensis 085-0475 TaxID=1094564 RepID=J0QKZ5_9HYPH|nr:hypothetical protein MCW_00172 [Bartonella washoeensis 085-0475]